MRNRFEQHYKIGVIPIEEVEVSIKSKDALPSLLMALKKIFVIKEYNEKIASILAETICKVKKFTGRKGMSLWEIFVLSMVRLTLNASYDRVHDLANNHKTLRSVMGVEPSDYSLGKQYEYQNIWDNLNLLDDRVLMEINDVIIEMGHGVFKKKEEAPLRVKLDTFVVESNVHFPTDYNLLWDSGKKCLECIQYFLKKYPGMDGWRKIKNWSRELKNQMRQLGRTSVSGGKNKKERMHLAAASYLTKANALKEKLEKEQLPIIDITDLAKEMEFEYFQEMLTKHIALVERRIIKGETIPHEEKLFSIFETYTEWITKGKLHPNVELGKKILICTDQYHLIVDYQVLDHQSDQEVLLPIVDRLLNKFYLESISIDRGFWNKDNKEILKEYIAKVIMPKRGKLTLKEKQEEHSPMFKRLKNRHSAVESNINELEHRGLDRCPDRGYGHYKRYVGLAICAYNLCRIGREIAKQQRQKQKKLKMAA